MKYSYVKYCLMRWDMIQDGWIKVEVLSIVIEWSLVDNLVTSENKGNSAEISKKKSHNLSHTIQYLTLVKKCLRFHDIIICGCYIGCVDSYYIFLFKEECKADHRQQQQFNKNQQQ
jgi:hypothetical protein